MAGFIFRARRTFTIEELTALEAVYVEDLDPQASISGIGTGVVCLIGEFDDGPIGELTEIEGGDITRQFGGLGYTYAGSPSQNACARKRNGEIWNGNGFLYSKFIRAPRFLVVRADSSVGEVAFSPQAVIRSEKGPFALANGDRFSGVTSSTGGPTAIGTITGNLPGTHTGSGPIVATGFVGGEQISIQYDDNPAFTVTFAASDQLAPAVVSRINAAAGAVIASEAAGTVTISGVREGTGGSLVLADVSAGALAVMLLTAGTYAGAGNVADLQVVTTTELAAAINADAGATAIDIAAFVDGDGRLAIYDTNAGTGSVLIASAGTMDVGLDPLDATVIAGEHAGGVIAAGTRVRNAGGDEWVVMESTAIAAGTATAPNQGPHSLKVRPAFDDGTALGAAIGAVDTLVDQPDFAAFTVNNASALTAALTDPQLDARYQLAVDLLNDATGPARDITYLYSARRSYALDVYAADATETASNDGFAGRKYIRSGALGITKAQALADAALIRSDRVFYTWPGWQVTIPEIQAVGSSGGVGFTDSGVITLRAHGTLAKVNALLPPEENPGQATGLLATFFAVEDLGFVLTSDDYKGLKAAGICAPRVDITSGSIFQSGVTTSLVDGRKTQARRKMADFIQDSVARALVVFSKKLATDQRRDAIVGRVDDFLATLLSELDPERQRIASYALSTEVNTETTEGLGIFTISAKVRTLASLDAIEFRTEIGEGVVAVFES